MICNFICFYLVICFPFVFVYLAVNVTSFHVLTVHCQISLLEAIISILLKIKDKASEECNQDNSHQCHNPCQWLQHFCLSFVGSGLNLTITGTHSLCNFVSGFFKNSWWDFSCAVLIHLNPDLCCTLSSSHSSVLSWLWLSL